MKIKRMKMENIDQWTIERVIEIDVSPEKVWRIFTDPVITRQLGGEYVSDWKVGDAFGWKGTDGTMYTKGIILQIEPGKLLKHNLLDPKNEDSVISEITYTLQYINGQTSLYAREDLNYDMTDDQYEEASDGWDSALFAMKKIAEKL